MKEAKQVDPTKFTLKSVTRTEDFYRKHDSDGRVVNNHFPGCYVLRGHYEGNDNYTLIVTDKELQAFGVASKAKPAQA